MSPDASAPLVVNGWTLFAHPLFLDELDVLVRKVESLRRKDPTTYRQQNATKRLAAIRKLIFEVIPQDPSRAEFRQGKTLGEQHKHWFRAKFFQQYRLFFRYHASSKVIVYAWGQMGRQLANAAGGHLLRQIASRAGSYESNRPDRPA